MYGRDLDKHQVFSLRNAWRSLYNLEHGRIVSPNEYQYLIMTWMWSPSLMENKEVIKHYSIYQKNGSELLTINPPIRKSILSRRPQKQDILQHCGSRDEYISNLMELYMATTNIIRCLKLLIQSYSTSITMKWHS